jgi:hypothetical protein
LGTQDLFMKWEWLIGKMMRFECHFI